MHVHPSPKDSSEEIDDMFLQADETKKITELKAMVTLGKDAVQGIDDVMRQLKHQNDIDSQADVQ